MMHSMAWGQILGQGTDSVSCRCTSRRHQPSPQLQVYQPAAPAQPTAAGSASRWHQPGPQLHSAGRPAYSSTVLWRPSPQLQVVPARPTAARCCGGPAHSLGTGLYEVAHNGSVGVEEVIAGHACRRGLGVKDSSQGSWPPISCPAPPPPPPPGLRGTPAGITTTSLPFRQSSNCSGPRWPLTYGT